jgi:hypothetical protein
MTQKELDQLKFQQVRLRKLIERINLKHKKIK